MRSYILFIGMLLGGLVITAIIGSTMDARLVDQEQTREQGYRSH